MPAFLFHWSDSAHKSYTLLNTADELYAIPVPAICNRWEEEKEEEEEENTAAGESDGFRKEISLACPGTTDRRGANKVEISIGQGVCVGGGGGEGGASKDSPC